MKTKAAFILLASAPVLCAGTPEPTPAPAPSEYWIKPTIDIRARYEVGDVDNLDVSHAFEVLELVKRLNRTEGRSIVLVLHDLNMAMRYADHVVLFDQGRVAVAGPTPSVLTEDRITEVFGIECRLIGIEGQDVPAVVPLPSEQAILAR